jgi:hypothetical protein
MTNFIFLIFYRKTSNLNRQLQIISPPKKSPRPKKITPNQLAPKKMCRYFCSEGGELFPSFGGARGGKK